MASGFPFDELQTLHTFYASITEVTGRASRGRRKDEGGSKSGRPKVK
jgi:hypothetical protein